MKTRQEFARPSIRLDKQFHDELKVMMIKENINFQQLATKLLENWYIDALYREEERKKEGEKNE